ncbi:MAG: AI-2E family transporter [Oscillospiraceae bacterium]|nr:AI-2E family transporter [Oscillospiraceae bacterium]
MKIEWKSCIRVGVSVFLLYLAIHYWDGLITLGGAALASAEALIVGVVMAYLLNILMSFYERHYPFKGRTAQKLRRAVCIVAALLSFVAVILLVVLLVVPELMAAIRLLMAEIPLALKDLGLWLQESGVAEALSAEELATSLAKVDWQQRLTELAKTLLEGVGGAAQVAVSAVSSAAGVVTTVVIGLIFALYLLVGKETLLNQFDRLTRRFLPELWAGRLRYVLRTLNECFRKFIVGQCMEAVVLGLLCMAGMTLLRFPYAAMVGTLVGFTALIPVAGAYIGAAVGAFMILTVSPIQAVWFIVFILVLQQLEGNLIYPRVVGSSIGLPGVWVLAAVTIGGGLMGVAGMLLGVPIAAAIYQMLRRDLHEHEQALAAAETDAPAADS